MKNSLVGNIDRILIAGREPVSPARRGLGESQASAQRKNFDVTLYNVTLKPNVSGHRK
jgi:hypothetical protein